VVKLRPLLASRSSNATSEGELTLVGTFGVEKSGAPLVPPDIRIVGKHAVEFDDDTWYARSGRHEANESRVGDWSFLPENDVVGRLDLKFSGAVGRVAVDINPSGAPVLKKVGSAAAAAAGNKPISAAEIASFACVLDIDFSPRNAARWSPMDRSWAGMLIM
jgi:hypothetical protein